MEEGSLKHAAGEIDRLLNSCQHKTPVHGDAKVANFCFSSDNKHVAAVDFQYVGGGCGMKDVAYFMGSCLEEQRCELWQDELLDDYFAELKKALIKADKKVNWEQLENEWRMMFPLAWADFYRFMMGWMPTHHKINTFMQRLAENVLAGLENH
jgi:thiamine kinase-like enzyme